MKNINKQTGRARAICLYETELTELLGYKHNMEPLAVSGSQGLLIRDDARPSTSQCNIPETANDINEVNLSTDNDAENNNNNIETENVESVTPTRHNKNNNFNRVLPTKNQRVSLAQQDDFWKNARRVLRNLQVIMRRKEVLELIAKQKCWKDTKKQARFMKNY